MNVLHGYLVSVILLLTGMSIPGQADGDRNNRSVDKSSIHGARTVTRLATPDRIVQEPLMVISFSHGNIDWLPGLASKAGWPEKTHKKLGEIILRESGGCPNRIGSSIVDKNCNITGYTKSTNKSDTGLLQINGVNYDPERNKWAIACREMNICTQEPLLDPLANLQVGYLLYQEAGWGPWDPCTWDKTRCSKTKKP